MMKIDISVDENSDSEIIEIERSMKIIEVIGQIIKNRSGSFKKIEIKELILEVEKLGLRILTYVLDTLKNPDFKEFIDTINGDIQTNDKRRIATQYYDKILDDETLEHYAIEHKMIPNV